MPDGTTHVPPSLQASAAGRLETQSRADLMQLAKKGDPRGRMLYIRDGGAQYHDLWKDASKGQQKNWRAIIIAAAEKAASDFLAKALVTRRTNMDAWQAALCTSLEEVSQEGFDAMSWVTDLISQTAGLLGRASSPILTAAGLLPLKDYQKVTTNFRKSPLPLKKSKPSASYRRKNPGAISAWHACVRESKVAYISGTPFPCQTGAVFPDARGAEKRLKTFLYYYSRIRHDAKPGPENDDKLDDDDTDNEDDDDVD